MDDDKAHDQIETICLAQIETLRGRLDQAERRMDHLSELARDLDDSLSESAAPAYQNRLDRLVRLAERAKLMTESIEERIECWSTVQDNIENEKYLRRSSTRNI